MGCDQPRRRRRREVAPVGTLVSKTRRQCSKIRAMAFPHMSTELKALGGGVIPVLSSFHCTSWRTSESTLRSSTSTTPRSSSREFRGEQQDEQHELWCSRLGRACLRRRRDVPIKGTPMEPIMRDVLAHVAVYSSTKLVTGQEGAVAQAGAASAMPASSNSAQTRDLYLIAGFTRHGRVSRTRSRRPLRYDLLPSSLIRLRKLPIVLTRADAQTLSRPNAPAVLDRSPLNDREKRDEEGTLG
jgi:hypothetical protein